MLIYYGFCDFHMRETSHEELILKMSVKITHYKTADALLHRVQEAAVLPLPSVTFEYDNINIYKLYFSLQEFTRVRYWNDADKMINQES